MKPVVLENVDRLDEKLSHYLNQYYKNVDLDVFCNLSTIEDNELQSVLIALSKTDKVIVCSTLSYENTEQFLDLIIKFKNIKYIEILYNYNQQCTDLIDFINNHNELNFKNKMIHIINERTVTQVYCAEYELETTGYFRKYKYLFDLIELYYNNEYSIVYFKTRPKQLLLNDFLLLNDKKENKKLKMSDSLYRELMAFLEYQKELRYKDQELVDESNKWINEFKNFKN